MSHTSGRSDEFRPSPGFQGSETSSAEVTIYPQGGDPVTVSSEPVTFTGRRASDASNSLVSASTSKAMGAPSGSWSFTCKAGRNDKFLQTLFHDVVDDDWIDITFKRHSRSWHVMRGLVGDIRRSTNVSGTGATSRLFTFSGSDFGNIWEKTPIWFNPYSAENLGGAISQKVFSAMPNNLGSPKEAVLAFLQNMLREIGDQGRATWILPENLPNRGLGSFVQAVDFNTDGYPAELDDQLVGLSQNWLNPQGNLWQLAKEWSDPLFNELYCDVLPTGLLAVDPANEVLVDDTNLTLIFRERPFPTVAEGKDSAWFSLPLNIVPRESILGDDVGKSGAERYNAFFVSPQITQELLAQNGLDILQPLWNPTDISRHGFRRFDVMTKYADKNADLLTISREHREKVMNWYCLNPYLLSGTLPLAILRPDIKIGSRVRIPGALSKDSDETYYAEQVSHAWQFGSGGRTSIGVTRGFIGQDDVLLETLQTLAGGFEIPQRVQPSVDFGIA